MIKKYPVKDADGNLAGILGEVEGETTVHLTKGGDTVAVVMSLEEYHRIKFGFTPRGDFRSALERFRAEIDLDELNIKEVYADIRDPSPDGN